MRGRKEIDSYNKKIKELEQAATRVEKEKDDLRGEIAGSDNIRWFRCLFSKGSVCLYFLYNTMCQENTRLKKPTNIV